MKRFLILMFLLLCVPVLAQRKLTTNEATILAVGPFFDSTDGITPETSITVTGLTVEIYRELDDGSICTRFANFVPTASGGSNDMALITSSVSGMYSLEITAAQVNFTGFMQITIVDTDSAGIVGLPFFRSFIISSANVVDAEYGTDKLQVDSTQIEGGDATSALDTALADINLDHLIYDPVDVSLTATVDDNSVIGYILAGANVSNYVRTTDSLEDLGENVADIETDTAAMDSTTELRTLMTGADTPVAKDSTPLTAAEAEAEAVDALESFNLDHVAKLAVDTNLQTTVHDDSVLGYMLASVNVSAYVRTTDSHEDLGENIADIETDTSAFDTAAEWLGLLSAVDTDATSATHATTYVTLEAGKASNDAYNGMLISVTDAGDSNVETRRIEDYTSGRKVTFDRALSFTPVQNDIIRIYGAAYDQLVAVAGGTANTYIVTDTGAVGGTGIADVAVWLTIDSAGARLITSGLTDDNGEVVFYLDSGITYYVWMSKSGYSFSDNGEAWVAD